MPHAQLADIMGMTGDNKSPHLRWEGFPAETESFAVTCLDPDAPTGSGFWHWLVVNIDKGVTELPTGAGRADGGLLPAGAVQHRNDAGTNDYVGAAPPPGHGDHRYIFVVHALTTPTIDLPAEASGAFVGFNLTFNTAARAMLTVTYGR
jgi:Raf kinase inhibitor-like YbhB/YbcL family protein